MVFFRFLIKKMFTKKKLNYYSLGLNVALERFAPLLPQFQGQSVMRFSFNIELFGSDVITFDKTTKPINL